MSAMVDLQQHLGSFHEPFYIVVAEKIEDVSGVMMHMWRLDVTSESDPDHDGAGEARHETVLQFTVQAFTVKPQRNSYRIFGKHHS